MRLSLRVCLRVRRVHKAQTLGLGLYVGLHVLCIVNTKKGHVGTLRNILLAWSTFILIH